MYLLFMTSEIYVFLCRMHLLFKVMSVESLLVTVVLLHGRLFRWFSYLFDKVSYCSFICFPNALCHIIQIEVPVGRGKPPVLVDKDESLDKVNSFK
jgi:hypothetical protein